jgi:acyl dehydratase
MTQRYGERWIRGGEMAVAFIKPVCAGDDIKVVIGERPVQRPEQVSAGQYGLQVDIYNQLGDLVAAGAASLPAEAKA